ncbi:hypothetical protein LTS18_005070 [Coniosporium uncinatum]|uniref:Uncharacterized protein n=1 Tax=Coniosporium uncinatum TaxID=93489 RepID=A0ACC3DYX9_9PEZI|nr:hypothetical protein LTS18_005070 [Coniosporium uncinatum]
MELVAVVTQDDNLDVYRFGGQRAFGVQRRKQNTKVRSLCWKFNGLYLALGWQDGSLDVISSESGIVVQSIANNDGTGAGNTVSSIGWGMHFIDVPFFKKRIASGKTDSGNRRSTESRVTEDWDLDQEKTTLEHFLEREPVQDGLDLSSDLPDQLATLDVQTLLPKLPVLPLLPTTATYKPSVTAETFSSQAALDSVLHPIQRDHYAVGVLLPVHEDMSVVPVFFDSLPIGTIRLPQEWGFTNVRPVGYASHPYSCSELLLLELPASGKRQDSDSQLALVPLTLRFIQSSGVYLHLIASKTSQLKYLLEYITSCIDSISQHWTTSQDLPSRFMANIDEELSEKGENNLVQSLFHLAVTGNCPPSVKEWLIDQLAERGHKRWDHAVSHGYTKILDLVHENLLPAIDRCSILISSLRGLAFYHSDSDVFNVPPEHFTGILSTLKCMRLLSHNVLICANEERRQFAVFSKWLRHEIDVQATDPTSASADETMERDLGLDYPLLMAYIRGAMTDSKVAPFLQPAASPASPMSQAEADAYDEVKESVESFKRDAAKSAEAIKLKTHCGIMKQRCEALLARISSWQIASTSMDCGLVLEDEQVAVSDVRILYQDGLEDENHNMTTYVVTAPSDGQQGIRIHCIVHADIFDNIKGRVRRLESCCIRLPQGEVKDLKIFDDEHLLLLWSSEQASHLLRIPYTNGNLTAFGTANSAVVEGSALQAMQLPDGRANEEAHMHAIEDVEVLRQSGFLVHTFDATDIFKPVRIEINGRKEQQSVVVLGENCRHYRIFTFKAGDLDDRMEEEGSEDDVEMTG